MGAAAASGAFDRSAARGVRRGTGVTVGRALAARGTTVREPTVEDSRSSVLILNRPRSTPTVINEPAEAVVRNTDVRTRGCNGYTSYVVETRPERRRGPIFSDSCSPERKVDIACARVPRDVIKTATFNLTSPGRNN